MEALKSQNGLEMTRNYVLYLGLERSARWFMTSRDKEKETKCSVVEEDQPSCFKVESLTKLLVLGVAIHVLGFNPS